MASQAPFPLMPPKSTELRLLHFDEYVYSGDTSSVLYKLVDALCGTTGAGALINEIFLARLGGALETIYFNDLDYIFSKINFLSRSPAESYPFDPMKDQLTSDQWDEVRVKDAWYRARIKDFFIACSLGGTPDGVRMVVNAAVGVDCDIYEVWRFVDNFGSDDAAWTTTWPSGWPASITAGLGRAPTSAHNEMVVRPHKAALLPEELRLLRDMLAKVCPVDVIITVNPVGLIVHSPVPISAAAASSTYYEVQKMFTATPMLDQLPPPELLPIDLLPTEQWLFRAKTTPQLAPYTAFNISAEYGYNYLVGGGTRSPIDSVAYGTIDSTAIDPMGTYRKENNYQVFDTVEQYSNKRPYEKADSPDNYPGGKDGITPTAAPAFNPDGTPYLFKYSDQNAYIDAKILEVTALGGLADRDGYRLPIQSTASAPQVFLPEYAIAYSPPAKDSTVSTSITHRRQGVHAVPELRDPINFVRT